MIVDQARGRTRSGERRRGLGRRVAFVYFVLLGVLVASSVFAQTPVQHVKNAPHAGASQPPQWLMSVSRSKHAPLQHDWPDGHVVPHAPQLRSSSPVVTVQRPPQHSSSPPHAVPQPPQLN